MLSQIPIGEGGFSFLILYGLLLGVLHTIMPCEDKFIFVFYAFGVARDWKQAFKIVNFYGFGLFTMNFIIGAIFSYIGEVLGRIEPLFPYRFIWNAISGVFIIISGLVMLYQIKRKKYWPHGDQLTDLTQNISSLRNRRRTAFLLGLLAGLPPCIFEIAVYSTALSQAAPYGFGNGVWIIFFFGIGTWAGLYPLTLVGTASGRLSEALRSTSMQRLQAKLNFNKLKNKLSWKKENSNESESKPEKTVDHLEDSGSYEPEPIIYEDQANSEDEIKFDPQPSKISIYSKIEIFSAIMMIVFGIAFLILAIFQVDLIPIENIPERDKLWPF